jgi:hypothetical protein
MPPQRTSAAFCDGHKSPPRAFVTSPGGRETQLRGASDGGNSLPGTFRPGADPKGLPGPRPRVTLFGFFTAARRCALASFGAPLCFAHAAPRGTVDHRPCLAAFFLSKLTLSPQIRAHTIRFQFFLVTGCLCSSFESAIGTRRAPTTLANSRLMGSAPSRDEVRRVGGGGGGLVPLFDAFTVTSTVIISACSRCAPGAHHGIFPLRSARHLA